MLQGQRETLGRFLRPVCGGVSGDEKEYQWWTFAGGRINSTLRYALSAVEPEWTVIPDNYAVKVRGAGSSGAWIDEAIERLGADDLRNDEAIWTTVRDSLPNYRLSKFQPLMPDWVEREVLTDYLLDIPGTRAWLEQTRATLRSDEV